VVATSGLVVGLVLLAIGPAGAQIRAQTGVPTGGPPPAFDASSLAVEAAWLLATQLEDGALATHPDRTFVNPYLAAFAAVGLADAGRATGDPALAQAAWRVAEWHGSVMSPEGTVTDYDLNTRGLVSTGDADSTDAYAGMFLVELDAAFRAAPDLSRLGAQWPRIRAAIDAIMATQRTDGLTEAKASWPVVYLMNEAEAYAGLQAAIRIGAGLRDPVLTADAARAATRMRQGVDALWNPTTGAYDWAVHRDGFRQPTNWDQLYPDAVSQVWAVRYGLVPPARAAALLTRFGQTHPSASDPNALDLVDGRVRPIGYWPGLGLALAAVDPDAPRRFLAGTRAGAAASGHAWPYSVQTAGDSIELVLAGA